MVKLMSWNYRVVRVHHPIPDDAIDRDPNDYVMLEIREVFYDPDEPTRWALRDGRPRFWSDARGVAVGASEGVESLAVVLERMQEALFKPVLDLKDQIMSDPVVDLMVQQYIDRSKYISSSHQMLSIATAMDFDALNEREIMMSMISSLKSSDDGLWAIATYLAKRFVSTKPDIPPPSRGKADDIRSIYIAWGEEEMRSWSHVSGNRTQ